MINLKNEELDSFEEKKKPIDARTDSNEVKSNPKVIAKNKKKFFINCFGCKIYYE
jgi:hypothetical protein|tara:strand:- start:257 stop:421 length:165 start_codon:yes stop_codon:yes gene_type:complete